MTYLTILLCAFMSCAKVTIQGYLSKGNIKNSTDSTLANCIIFGCTFILFSSAIRKEITPAVICYSALFGALGVAFQVFYSLSLKSGPFSASCMLVNLNMVLPVVFSIVFYDESVTATKVIGIILCLFALFLNIQNDGKKINLKWAICVALAFFSTGGIGIVQKIFAKSEYGSNIEQFIFFGYLIAFILSYLIFFLGEKKVHNRTFKINKRTMLLTFLIASCLGAFQFFYTYGNSFIDAIILAPSVSGLATILQMLSGRIIFKEKFTARQICSMCVGVVAILLMSI